MKIGILTYHRSRNYGAFLQACSLCDRLNQEPEIEAEIIDYNMKKAEVFYSVTNWSIKRRFRHFKRLKQASILTKAFKRGYKKAGKFFSKESLCTDNIEAFQRFVSDKYDVLIAGSDEIWKLDGFRKFPNPYWLPGDLGCRKFSYAASSRTDFSILNQSDHRLLSKMLNEFELISVRDKPTYLEVVKVVAEPSKVILSCDPSFLSNFFVAKRPLRKLLRGKATLDQSKKTIVIMLDEKKIWKKIRPQLEGQYNLIAVFNGFNGCQNVFDLDPFEWLELIANADLVISSFFHGICFSIVNNTSFIAVATEKKRSKLDDLLLGTAFEERYVFGDTLMNNDWDAAIKRALLPIENAEFLGKLRSEFDIFLDALHNN